MPAKKKCSLSIVSHGQFKLVKNLLSDLEKYSDYIFEIILTLNIPEQISTDSYKNKIVVLRNQYPIGFGKNHNNAFKKINGDFFFILNPDLRIHSFNFESFINNLTKKRVGVLSPIVLDSNGEIEDHVREFPTFKNLMRRFFTKKENKNNTIMNKTNIIDNKWIAGMFMAFKSIEYQKLQGFDERFYMYLEDVDICKRIIDQKLSISVDYSNKVIHDAQRDSHKKLKLFLIHCHSYFKYFIKWNF